MGGEFGFALLTLLLKGGMADTALEQALLTTVALSMLLGPLLVRYNGRIADFLLRRPAVQSSEMALETAATRELAKREHVIICGFGRVGQNLARVLEKQGFEYIALDLDPFRVRDARQAGDPVVYGDAAQPEVLSALGLAQASVVVVSFDGPDTALRIVRAVRQLRADVPVLVRTEDDSRLEALQSAGATEVVPEIFETSLSLVSHVLLFLDVAPHEVLEVTEDIRHDRYAVLRSVFQRREAASLDERGQALQHQLHTVVLPPGAKAVGRTLGEVGLDRGRVVVTALRREGIVGREPDPGTRLREGDVLVLWGSPEDLERGERRLLMGWTPREKTRRDTA
jgi:CPA2 family monovalent cation:H+ antiporter-2